MRKYLIAAVAVAVLAGSAGAAGAVELYNNGFESASTAGFTFGGLQGGPTGGIFTAPDGKNFVGILTQGGFANLTLTGLTVGSSLNLQFDVYGLHSLDDDNPSTSGGDFFNLTRQDTGSLIVHDEYGFVTCGETNSCYFAPNPNTAELPQTGSFVSYDPTGFGMPNAYYGAVTYHYNLNVANVQNSSLTLSFVGAANQPWDDEGFGLDNVVVNSLEQQGPGPIPEPATWAVMIMGFGAAGSVLRRRKALMA